MLLGLDLGTTNIKALVTDFGGHRLGEGVRPIERYDGEGGKVEQDIEEIWQAALEAMDMAVRDMDPAGIKAIGVSSQGGAMQLLDARRRPAGRVISWLDRRGQPFDRELTKELGQEWFAKRIGHRHSGLAMGQLLRLRREQSAQLARPNRIGFVGDLSHRKKICRQAGRICRGYPGGMVAPTALLCRWPDRISRPGSRTPGSRTHQYHSPRSAFYGSGGIGCHPGCNLPS